MYMLSFVQFLEGKLTSSSDAEFAFLKQVMLNPKESITYLMYSDWLKERGDYFGDYLEARINQDCQQIRSRPDLKKFLQFEKRYLLDDLHKIRLVNQPQGIARTSKEAEYHELTAKEQPLMFKMLHARNASPQSAWTWIHFPQNNKTYNVFNNYSGRLDEPYTVRNSHINKAMLSRHAIREFIVRLARYQGHFKCWEAIK